MTIPDTVLVTAQTDTPVTLAEAKAQLRVDHDDEDTLITSLLGAACEFFDGKGGYLYRCLMPQTQKQYLDAFPAGVIELPLGPVVSVTSVTYIDADGATQTLDAGAYTVHLADGLDTAFIERDYNTQWPVTRAQKRAVAITYQAGYPLDGDDAPTVPLAIRQAVLMLVAHWYLNREAVKGAGAPVELPFAIDALVQSYRKRMG